MKKNYLSLIAILLSVSFFAACGGGSAPKKLGTNDYLGDLPAVCYYYKTTDSTIKADEEAQYTKLGDKITMGKAKEISDKAEAKKKENKQKFDEGVAKAKETLAGKALPFEVKVSNYEISDLKISNVSPYSVKAVGSVTITEETPAPRVITFQRALDLYYVFVDKNDNIIGYSQSMPIIGDHKKLSALPGEKYDFDLTIMFHSNIPKYADFAKVIFVTQEEYEAIPR